MFPMNHKAAQQARALFITKFVDTTTPLFAKIQAVRLDRTVTSQTTYMLRDTLITESRKIVRYEDALSFLRGHTGEIRIMWDLESPMEEPFAYESARLLKKRGYTSETILIASPLELAEIIKADNSENRGGAYSDRHFPEDVYLFDDTYEWYIAITHSFFIPIGNTTEERLCFSNRDLSHESKNPLQV